MPADLTARRRALALAVVALATLAPLSALAAPPAQAETTSSAKTVTAKDYDPDAANAPFPDLRVSVSQTDGLIQQGIKVTWTGAKKSTVPNQQTGGSNFLQVAQCWGDEPGSNGTRPDRTTCQYGGFNSPGASRWSERSAETLVPAEDRAFTAVGAGWWEPTRTAIPFKSATGTTVASIVNGERIPDAPDLNNNEFFTKYTSNEVSWAGSGADGSGSVSFELQTAQQSPGLGCGSPIVASSGSVTGSACWLVLIPRGTADPYEQNIISSGLFWDAWKHHVAIRLGFKPIGLHCAIGAAERQVSGSELISTAMGQWQPKLCNKSGGAVYSLLTGSETDAGLAANGTVVAPMAIMSRALSQEGVTDALTYAPLALTGVSVAFSIDRTTRPVGIGDPVPNEVRERDKTKFTSLRLTPRLLAKLLTSSYVGALPNGSNRAHVGYDPPKTYGVANITQDPEFLAINDPDWAYQSINSISVSDAIVPLGRSDTAQNIWSYILADPAAAAFLRGERDNVRSGDQGNSGMAVNPYFSTSARVNPTGVALQLPRSDFPKADPSESDISGAVDGRTPITTVTWRPYTSSLDSSGYLVLRGDGQILTGTWNAQSSPPAWERAVRQLPGFQGVVGLTDIAAAEKYQVVQASLLNPAGKFVSPSDKSLAAAAKVMKVDPNQEQVVLFDPKSDAAKSADAAYPLAMPVYAAVNPAMEDAGVRADYASFIKYAVGDGQTPGTDDGQLPAGYAPLPSAWKKRALAAAAVIKAGGAVTPTPTTTSSTSGTGTSSSGGTVDTSPVGGTSSNPASIGDPAGSLTGANTPVDPAIGVLATVVPTGAALGLVAALGVPLMSRFRRRQT